MQIPIRDARQRPCSPATPEALRRSLRTTIGALALPHTAYEAIALKTAIRRDLAAVAQLGERDAATVRRGVALAVEAVIEILDEFDGDTDLEEGGDAEPYLASRDVGRLVDCDTSDHERESEHDEDGDDAEEDRADWEDGGDDEPDVDCSPDDEGRAL